MLAELIFMQETQEVAISLTGFPVDGNPGEWKCQYLWADAVSIIRFSAVEVDAGV